MFVIVILTQDSILLWIEQRIELRFCNKFLHAGCLLCWNIFMYPWSTILQVSFQQSNFINTSSYVYVQYLLKNSPVVSKIWFAVVYVFSVSNCVKCFLLTDRVRLSFLIILNNFENFMMNWNKFASLVIFFFEIFSINFRIQIVDGLIYFCFVPMKQI